jgi:hypothetical protein
VAWRQQFGDVLGSTTDYFLSLPRDVFRADAHAKTLKLIKTGPRTGAAKVWRESVLCLMMCAS